MSVQFELVEGAIHQAVDELCDEAWAKANTTLTVVFALAHLAYCQDIDHLLPLESSEP